jgi:hypothetical protein
LDKAILGPIFWLIGALLLACCIGIAIFLRFC